MLPELPIEGLSFVDTHQPELKMAQSSPRDITNQIVDEEDLFVTAQRDRKIKPSFTKAFSTTSLGTNTELLTKKQMSKKE